MYKCLDCGHLFEEGEQAVWEERHGLDTPPYEKRSGCPVCEGDYEETKRCAICGSEHLNCELIESVCQECFEEHSSNIDVCYKASKDEKETVELNAFLVAMFDSETIEEILMQHLKEVPLYLEMHKSNMKDFIDSDKSWFAEKIMEVFKNEVK